MEWVAVPFSRGPSQLRDRIQVSRTAGRFYQLSHSGSEEQVVSPYFKNGKIEPRKAEGLGCPSYVPSSRGHRPWRQSPRGPVL